MFTYCDGGRKVRLQVRIRSESEIREFTLKSDGFIFGGIHLS